jgi:hypothetical protein
MLYLIAKARGGRGVKILEPFVVRVGLPVSPLKFLYLIRN